LIVAGSIVKLIFKEGTVMWVGIEEDVETTDSGTGDGEEYELYSNLLPNVNIIKPRRITH
jgi:hypothetical protein